MADLTPANDDRNLDGVIDLRDLESICAALLGGTATRDEIEGFLARQNTGPGDANFDHRFDSSDLVAVFQRGKYESNSPASWSAGDWNCDGEFDSADLVLAFQTGNYEPAARPGLNDVAAAVEWIFANTEKTRMGTPSPHSN